LHCLHPTIHCRLFNLYSSDFAHRFDGRFSRVGCGVDAWLVRGGTTSDFCVAGPPKAFCFFGPPIELCDDADPTVNMIEAAASVVRR